MKRRRVRRLAGWTGLAVCLVLMLGYIASGWWVVYLRSSHGNGIGLWPGRLAIEYRSGHVSTAVIVPRSWLSDPGTRSRPTGRSPTGDATFRFGFNVRRIGVYRAWFIPLWVLMTPSAMITLALWNPEVIDLVTRLRLGRPGHCACGYDLAGNVSGICPECGAAAPAR